MTIFSETQIFVLTNNLRCFDETDVRTSQKTTYAQFKIYRTNFIDEIGPRIKTWSNISFLLSLSHTSYDTNRTAQPYTSY